MVLKVMIVFMLGYYADMWIAMVIRVLVAILSGELLWYLRKSSQFINNLTI